MERYSVGRVVGPAVIPVGHIDRSEDRRASFTYAPSYLEAAEHLPLSLSLPLRQETYGPQEAESYFRGLVPEGAALSALAAQAHASEDDWLTILGSSGLDCAGDVLVESGDSFVISRPWNEGDYAPLDDNGLRMCMQDMASLATSNFASRLSLAGTQGKVGLAHREDEPLDRGWMRPLGGAASTHILKVCNLSRIARFEVLCMAAAKACGINAATTSVLGLGDPVVVSERFDREILPGTELNVRRLHQEDLAQAFGVSPQSKYMELEGGTYARITELLLRRSLNPLSDIEQLARRAVFDYLIGNCDNHLKNLSIMAQGGGIRLAPAYDLVCTTFFERFSREMGRRLGSTRNIDDVEPSDFSLLAKDLNLGVRRLRRICSDLAESIAPALLDAGEAHSDVLEPLPFDAEDLIGDLSDRTNVVAAFGRGEG